MPLTSNYPRRRLSAIVEGQRPSTPQGSGYGDLRQWAGHVVEKVRVASVGGRLRFLPWFDPYSDETPEMRAEYRHMLRESSVKAAYQTKVLAVIAEDVQFQPDNEDDPREKEAASFYAYAFKKLGTTNLGWSILHPAIMDGHSVCEKVWDPEPVRTGKFRGKRVFKYVKAKDTHFLQLGIDPYRNITALRGTGFNAGRVWSPSDFVIFSYFSLFENPSGTSDFRAAYRPYWIKDTSWKLRSLHLEKWTGPFIVGHYTNQESREALEEAFDEAKSSTWLTVPQGDVVECLDLAMKGTSDFKDAIADCDREILIAIVGAHLQILEGQTGGARGNTKVHKEIGELIQWWLAAKLADVYREQLVIPLKEENYWDVEAPNVTIGAVTDEAMLERLKVYEGMQKLGLKLSQKAAYRSFNMQPPEDPDDELKPPGQGGQGPGGPASPGGPPMPAGGPDQGGGGLMSEDGPLHDWASMSEADWACFAASDWQPYTVTRGKNKGKQAWKHTKSGRISYEDPAAREKERAGKEEEKKKAKEQAAAAKAKAASAAKAAKEKAKADAAAKKKAEAEAAKARAAAAKEAAAKKAGQQRQGAAQHIRDVVSGSATTTPAKVRAAGAHLLNMTATELRALKSEIGAKGGGAARAGLVAAITERALAARGRGGRGKGKAAPAKAAKPAAGKAPKKTVDDFVLAAPRVTGALTGPDADEVLQVAEEAAKTLGPQEFAAFARHHGIDVSGSRPAMLQHFKNYVNRIATSHGQTQFLNTPEEDAAYRAREDAARARMAARQAGLSPATTLPGDQQAALEKRKFTGTDRLGRKWVNGELVAKEEGPAGKGPDARQEFEANDGSKVQVPAYDEDGISADFALPGEPALLGDVAEAVGDQVRRQGYAAVADVFDAVKAKHPDLDVHDFHRQLLAWGNRGGLLDLQRVNDTNALSPGQLRKSPSVVSPADPTNPRKNNVVLGTIGLNPGWREHAPDEQAPTPGPAAPAKPAGKPKPAARAKAPEAAPVTKPVPRITPAHAADVTGAFEDMALYQEVRRDGMMRTDQALDVFNRKTGLNLSPKEWAGFLEAAHRAGAVRLNIVNEPREVAKEPEYAATVPHFNGRTYGFLEPPRTPEQAARLEAFAREYASGQRQIEPGNTLADELARAKGGK